MEEPKKVLKAQYLGQIQVTSATGMDILNDAIELMKETFPSPEQWRHVNVAVAPSMISIMDPTLRYQKCLDAHPQSGVGSWGGSHGGSNGGLSAGNTSGNGQVTGSGTGAKGITATLKLLVGSLTGGRRGGKNGNRTARSSAVGSVASNNNDS
ncbi:hypothetical protein J437_LFUL008188 [Ladona fulva]|uniref:Uncharacterized protein n=1 Tax=Ladona fulva TaxID=123851 RepID=A0A8K0NZ60_LADFU|nr:hypothetical protein J437_LFUL008188 [Ladona fulva]